MFIKNLFQNFFKAPPKPNLDDIIDQLDDYDLLLFRGQDYWFSYVVEYATWSDFSHVGLVLKGAPEISPELTSNLFLESGAEQTPDVIEHKIKWGVQITDLQKVIENYTGQVYSRKLIISDELRIKLKEQLYTIYQDIADAPYDCDVHDLIRAELNIDVGDVQKTDKFFCSALVSYFYVKLGLLTPTLKWDLITPKEFSTDYITNQLLEDVSFGPLVRIK